MTEETYNASMHAEVGGVMEYCGVCLVTQLCVTLCNPGTVAHHALLFMGILQARILEWVAMTSSRGSSQPKD